MAGEAQDLQKLWDCFHELNNRYFHGNLPEPGVIDWMRSTCRGGVFRFWRQSTHMEIRLSLDYHLAYGWPHTRSTLLHEMVHLYQYVNTGNTRDRDPTFQHMLQVVGASPHCKPLPPTTEFFAYLYQCRSCGYLLGTQRLFKRPHIHRGCGGRLALVSYRQRR